MRDFSLETTKRIEFICHALRSAGARGVVFGNSGGKDSALVGILCKMACDNTIGVILPCATEVNYASDRTDALVFARQYAIETREVDLAGVKSALVTAMGESAALSPSSLSNIAPRLRMTTLYAIAASENLLVAGTGNKSEIYTGYFTKWGDGGYDFNPISDLTTTEVREFLQHLCAPEAIIQKAPSAGLFVGQTDEAELGVTYAAIDAFLSGGEVSEKDREIIERLHKASEHKRNAPIKYN